jgi:hypothetical protein
MGDLPATPAHPLFVETPIVEAYASLRAEALAVVDELTSEILLTADLPRLRQGLVGTYRFRPLLLHWDQRIAKEAGGGLSLLVSIRFTGAKGLFNMRPARDDGEHPVGWVSENRLVLVLPADRDKAHREFDRQKALVTDWASRINGDVEPLNQRLAKTIRTRVTSDAKRLREAAALAREFGPPRLPRARREADDSRRARVAAGDPRRLLGVPPSKPGRPPASREFNLERYEEALRETPEPRTQEAVAASFRKMNGRVGVSPRYLRRLLHDIEASAE